MGRRRPALSLAWGLVVMAVVGPLLKALPFGKKSGHEHEEGDVRAELAGYRPAKHDDGSAG